MKIAAIGQQLHILAVDVGPENVNIGPVLHRRAHDRGAEILLEVDADQRGPLKEEAELVRELRGSQTCWQIRINPRLPCRYPVNSVSSLTQVSQDDAGVLKQGKAGRCRRDLFRMATQQFNLK